MQLAPVQIKGTSLASKSQLGQDIDELISNRLTVSIHLGIQKKLEM